MLFFDQSHFQISSKCVDVLFKKIMKQSENIFYKTEDPPAGKVSFFFI